MVFMLLILRGFLWCFAFLLIKKKNRFDLEKEHSVVLCGRSELEC